MSNTENGLLTAFQFAALWFGASMIMVLHIIGNYAGWWPHDSITWWLVLFALLAMNVLQTVDYARKKGWT